MDMKILVVGAGYVGEAWGKRRLGDGDLVTAMVRSAASRKRLEDSGCPWTAFLSGDAADAGFWDSLTPAYDVVLYCPSTRGGGMEDYRHIHETGLKHALDHAQTSQARFFYTSSTSVFGQNDGEWVREEDASPLTEKARVLDEAEQRVLSVGGTVLRLSGIYGPERMYHLRRLEGEVPSLPGDGSRIMNMIHRDDIGGALDFLIAHPEQDGGLFNVTDDEPVSLLDFYRWLCPKLGRPVPPVGGEETGFSRGLTSKRISNRKLRSLGWELQFPTFREGYAELLNPS